MATPPLARFLAPLAAVVVLSGPATLPETRRIEHHLRSAELRLANRDVSALSAEQRANRRQAMALLAEYRAAGMFPKNEHFPGRQVPYFRDRHGTLCAMAYLLERTGHGDIVERVARRRNNAWVVELADEPGLAEWLDRFGLTLAEAARIQPAYGPPGTIEERGRLTAGYAVASLIGVGLAGTGAVLNLTAPREQRRLAWLAAGAGFVTTMLGAAKLDNGGDVRKVAVADVVIGGVATLIGLNGLFAPADRAPLDAKTRAQPFNIAMTVGPDGSPGLSARLRF